MPYAPRMETVRYCLLLTLLMAWASVSASFAQNCGDCFGSKQVSGLAGTVGNSFSNNKALLSTGTLDLADPWTIRKRVDEVTVFFTVTKGKKYVNDLVQEEISVKDDKKPAAKISVFGHQSELPLRMGLLVDTSNSVHYRFRFEQEAASRFLQKIVRPQWDRAFVMGFSDHLNLTQDYTDDTARLAHGVSALRSDGGTALFDAVREGCRKLADEDEGQPTARILVVLSDGDDNASKNTLGQVIESALRQEVTIYTISTNNSGYLRPGDKIMKEMAVQSGGQTFAPNSAKETVKAFALIEQEMRSRYMLSYQPSDLLEDGRYRRIEILAQRSNHKFHVHARKGYFARITRSANENQ